MPPEIWLRRGGWHALARLREPAKMTCCAESRTAAARPGPGAASSARFTVDIVAEWWSIEVFHGEFSAARWKDSYGSALTESAVTHGAVDWEWHEYRWGVIFQISFADDAQWTSFRELPQVQAALDAVPDRVNGLLIYRGRGGSSGTPSRRPRRPSAGAGALELPEPEDDSLVDLADSGPERLAGAVG
jgi:hypothetical protein